MTEELATSKVFIQLCHHPIDIDLTQKHKILVIISLEKIPFYDSLSLLEIHVMMMLLDIFFIIEILIILYFKVEMCKDDKLKSCKT